MNFDVAHKRLILHGGAQPRRGRVGADKPVHRPSIALILIATAVQIIAMAAVLGSVGSLTQ